MFLFNLSAVDLLLKFHFVQLSLQSILLLFVLVLPCWGFTSVADLKHLYDVLSGYR